tara:strand:- start:815 stop:1465 length:651 start_codon:yes stop_codon:yes gene_type:complete
MSRRSSGKRAFLIDDRSGRKIRYKDARREWNGLRVHKKDWEGKQPQLDPVVPGPDVGALYQPRPDNDQDLSKVRLGPLNGNFQAVISLQFNPDVIISTTEDSVGLGLTSAQNAAGLTFSAQENAVMSTATSSLGSLALTAQTNPSGQAGTSAQGTGLTFNLTENLAGIAATSAQGTITASATVSVSGLQMTASRGTITFGQPGWGNNAFGEGAWNA